MEKKTKKVLELLKPKASKFGFNKKELQGIAKQIADNLKVEEDVSDEDLEAACTTAVDAAIPFLQYGQVMGNRLLDKYKSEHDVDDDDDENDIVENKGETKQSPEMKALMESIQKLTNEVSSLKKERVASSYKSQLEEALKDAGAFGKSILKNFGRMNFETEEEFTEYLDGIKEDVKVYQQEVANNGLKGNIPGSGINLGDDVFTDDEIKALLD